MAAIHSVPGYENEDIFQHYRPVNQGNGFGGLLWALLICAALSHAELRGALGAAEKGINQCRDGGVLGWLCQGCRALT